MTVAAAFFDVDGTILRGNIVRYFVDLRTAEMQALNRALWICGFLPRVPYYWLLDRVSRRVFNNRFYRNYQCIRPDELGRRAEKHFVDHMRPRLYVGALDKIREHQSLGHSVVLVTGSLEPLVSPLARHLKASAVIAAQLEEVKGAFTGRLTTGPISDQRKAVAVSDYATAHGLTLDDCFAYADSLDDLPMLETVGRAGVVNPSSRLAQAAKARGWEIFSWN